MGVKTPIQSHLTREEVGVSINVPFLYVIMPYAGISGEGGGGGEDTHTVPPSKRRGRCP